MTSQNQRLLNLLRERRQRGITPAEAWWVIGTMRLAARVFDLRKQGHDIRSEPVVRNGATVARYVLHEG